jgi:hypothetical protein
MFALLGFVSFAASQNATGPAPEGFFGQIEGYAKEIETGTRLETAAVHLTFARQAPWTRARTITSLALIWRVFCVVP